MLVLSRKTGQKLIINDNIEVIVIETRGEFVRLGIKAPKDVTIFREEIYEEVKKANQQALTDASVNELDLDFDLLQKKNKIDSAQIAQKFRSSLTQVKKDK